MHLGRGFNAFGHGLHAQLGGQCGDGLDDGGVASVVRQVTHEGTVDLQTIDRQILDVRQ